MISHFHIVTRLIAYAVLILLSGCTSRYPAPVSNVNSNYGTAERGSYRGSYYMVKKGDTLYFISYVTDKDVKDLIAYNDLKSPYLIHPGQKLELWQPKYSAPVYGKSSKHTDASDPKITSVPPVITPYKSTSSKSKPQSGANPKAEAEKKVQSKKVDNKKSEEYSRSSGKQNVNKNSQAKLTKVNSWLWPTKGRVISKFSNAERGNKGIDIAGQRGQQVVSTAKGVVVYSGNALKGYGNLIIIKHNEDYLSAYAHNERLFVKEGQSIKAGQKIALMGSSGSDSVRLHFEIRYKGKSVNPQRYLP